MDQPIVVDHAPSPERLAELGVYDWPIWSKEASSFPWHYDGRETCYILEGEVEVTPEGGEPVRFGSGALVVFADGLDCHWNIIRDVRKHYRID